MNLNRYIRSKFGVKGQGMLPLIATARRQELAKLFFDLGYKVGAEIGVCEGAYSEVLFQANPGVKLYCVDPWAAPYGRHFVTQESMDGLFESAKEKLSAYDVTYIRKRSMEALADFADSFLDFVYIDAAHDFDNVISDIVGWSKKVKPGGIVSGHDYVHTVLDSGGTPCGVIPAVRSYTEAHGIIQWFVTIDRTPSWFWVR